ncbi:cytochrome P450 [Annulohypoxylon maeteangense]|uniref:cytochrome P450 n=1 Tax=Annulohypoxylon maeteangense TaxID=1927788 RepID=UPI002008815E|nr:cytochrome P450 [Annulohypoxylon maeteangense]KAI0886348.1 cytochrome P450 [Annulohypoxylon maeteangense]
MLSELIDVIPQGVSPLSSIFIMFITCWVATKLFSKESRSKDLGRSSPPLDLLMNPLSTIKKRFKAWSFLLRGPLIIQDAYDRAKGAPFTVDAPDNRYILVSSWDQIREIDAAADSVLSLQAAAREVLQPKHTMVGFEWHDRKGFDGAPLLRTIRYLLTEHLPYILPDIRTSISHMFDQRYESHPIVNNQKLSPIYPMVIGAVARSNAYAFFGQELSKDEKFMEAGMVFIEQTLLIAEVVRLLPHSISGYIGDFLAKRLNSGKIIYDSLEPVVSKRFEERELRKRGHNIPEQKDCIQWIMETSPKTRPWTVQRVIHELLAVWFGSVHITSTTTCFALFDLCLHPEYVEPLRKEIENTTWKAFEESSGQLFPLMDSFMKESARLTPVESVSTRRKATKPFQLSDGTKVQVGQWICSAVRGMNLDPGNWSQADEFHGFRFVPPNVLERSLSNTRSSSNQFQIPDPEKSSEFVDSSGWQLWGTGKSACTGRWYASAMIKIILGTFITKWDMELADPKAARHFCWRTFIYPIPSTKFILTPRVQTAQQNPPSSTKRSPEISLLSVDLSA